MWETICGHDRRYVIPAPIFIGINSSRNLRSQLPLPSPLMGEGEGGGDPLPPGEGRPFHPPVRAVGYSGIFL
jgi:hypothetical protein